MCCGDPRLHRAMAYVWRATTDEDEHYVYAIEPYDGSVRESLHECQSDVEALRLVYENHSTGTSKACASFAMVSGVPVRRPLSRSDK